MKVPDFVYVIATYIQNRKKEKSESDKLIENIIEARSELERAEHAFNEMTEQAAIDYAAYSIMAARAKYVHLLNIAKEENVRF